MASSSTNPITLSTTRLDPRILDKPIPLLFYSQESTEIQDSLLPYFALGYMPVRTDGAENLECGLHALAISYNAARNEFRDLETARFPPIPVDQWREWFFSEEYEAACIASFDERHIGETWGSSEELREAELSRIRERANIDMAALMIILDLANTANGTKFQLGVLTAGWRGRRERVKDWRNPTPLDVAGSEEPARVPLTGRFDNYFLSNANAALTRPLDMNHPILWIFNDSGTDKTMAIHNRRGGYSHWEGFSREPLARKRTDYKIQMVHDFEVGALAESDVAQGVWYLTKDSSSEDKPGYMNAFRGSFLRDQPLPAGRVLPRGTRYMRSCIGWLGYVNEADIVKIEIAGNMVPVAGTDPTEERKEWPWGLSLPPLPRNKTKEDDQTDKTDKSSNMTSSETGPKTPVDLLKQPWYYHQPLPKIYRVLFSTNKLGKQTESPQKSTKNNFQLNAGDFVLDTGRKKNSNHIVKDLAGAEGEVPARKLQLLTHPWGLPDELPFANMVRYEVPGAYPLIVQLSNLYKLKCANKDEVTEKLKDLLDAKKKNECIGFDLHRITRSCSAVDGCTTSFEKGEIVMRERDQISIKDKEGPEIALKHEAGDDCVVVNYEGNRNRVPKDRMELLQGEAWGLPLLYIFGTGKSSAKRGREENDGGGSGPLKRNWGRKNI